MPVTPSWRPWRAAVAVLSGLLVLGAVPASAQSGAQSGPPSSRPVSEAPDQLTPEQDNADPKSIAPCTDKRSPTGSLVIRRLVDGPRKADGSLAFRSGVCIYLPPGYEQGGTRYPVLYLLHGGGGWQEDWVVQGKAQEVMDEAYAEDPRNAMIVVMPDGTTGANWEDRPDGSLLNETYVVDRLIPYVDTYLRTIPDRRGRAISGLSMGGAGSLRLASLRPDRFGVVTAMSAALPLNMATDRTDVRRVANDPTEIIDNLEQVELAVIYGRTCSEPDAPQDCPPYAPVWAFEHACCSNELYAAKASLVRQRPWKYEPVVGGHSWDYWTAWLRGTHGDYIREALVDPVPALGVLPQLEPPATFRYRSIRPTFEVYDWTFANDPARAREFLTTTGVSSGGFTVRGSGTVATTTAAVYRPGRPYTVSGAGDAPLTLRADPRGRLSFPVDLGPAHTADEGTAQARLAEAQAPGDYWTTRTVTITPQS